MVSTNPYTVVGTLVPAVTAPRQFNSLEVLNFVTFPWCMFKVAHFITHLFIYQLHYSAVRFSRIVLGRNYAREESSSIKEQANW